MIMDALAIVLGVVAGLVVMLIMFALLMYVNGRSTRTHTRPHRATQ
jgi:hypothetical protein